MDSLIAKYFFDELNQEEERQLLDWIAANPENAEQFVHSKALLTISDSEGQYFNPDAEKAWKRIRMNQSSGRSGNVYAFDKAVSGKQWLRIAAIFIGLIVLTYMIVSLNYFNRTPEQMVIAGLEKHTDEIVEITSDNGTKVVYLPDSSLVFLNKNSRIVYSKLFDGDTREIYLEGESFFEVTPDAERPFCVYTTNTKTRVLGTAFDVKAYRNSQETEVTVAHGKVVFFLEGTARDGIIVLESKDKVIFDRKLVSLTKYRDVGNGYMAWMNNFESDDHEVRELKINEKLLISPYSKEVVYEREARDPVRYINNVSNWNNTYEWKNHLVKKTMIEGELYSSAIVANYEDISLKATFYNAENQVIGAEIFMVKEAVKPGNIVVYKRKLDQYFEGTSNVIVELYHAEVQDRS